MVWFQQLDGLVLGLVRCSIVISFVSGSFGPMLYFGVLLL